ncbi:hypothetical protein SEA_THUNDERCLAP_77 [Arthrobacter phage Thunderclap]|uniref:Uncharacterized protein n=9 Tax=Amigovirus amigo TaxID=1982100 RepID=A0A5J6TF55_9CAUD|nr:hypothetical protein FDH66_gp27 [Arthrobacter phage Amigo]ALY08520.1 hypothetical protein ANANSI_77 [Arthrobacter phage Anansi]ALY09134.1 hypothetical protein GORGEOUS_77 [Arthrobacter phage Gorgeous]ALY10415.1 hypothetical protein SORJUANA_77 [Arthrobacter phage SorJuana]QFG08369.1 hypothetical protein SEA_YEEZUS_77 [Arthrobacter phage Yeezus]QFG13418.1 hypothetical protein SEA_ICHOR_77 [Arthrobacter phage Ichor]QFG13936.1 hypothetical protein SEA_JAEK_77 [Arthrobacter phage Jaek]QJD5172
MTKETRVNVNDRVRGVLDLQVGDRIAFKATRGKDMRMNSSFTYGGTRGGYILDADGLLAVSIGTFLKNISGWDDTEWNIWRKVTPFPEKNGIIYVNKLRGSQAAGFFINRGNGLWQGVIQPDLKIFAGDIVEWKHATLDYK